MVFQVKVGHARNTVFSLREEAALCLTCSWQLCSLTPLPAPHTPRSQDVYAKVTTSFLQQYSCSLSYHVSLARPARTCWSSQRAGRSKPSAQTWSTPQPLQPSASAMWCLLHARQHRSYPQPRSRTRGFTLSFSEFPEKCKNTTSLNPKQLQSKLELGFTLFLTWNREAVQGLYLAGPRFTVNHSKCAFTYYLRERTLPASPLPRTFT